MGPRDTAEGLEGNRPARRRLVAQGPLRPLDPHRDPADGDPASVITFIFLERHWALVTNRLSTVLTQDLAAIIDIYESYPQDKNLDTLTRIAQDRMKIDIEFLPPGPLPPVLPKPFFSIVDGASRTRSASRSVVRSGSTRSAART